MYTQTLIGLLIAISGSKKDDKKSRLGINSKPTSTYYLYETRKTSVVGRALSFYPYGVFSVRTNYYIIVVRTIRIFRLSLFF